MLRREGYLESRVEGEPGGIADLVRVAVLDTGIGLAPDVLPRLFQPFFSTRAGGLGLGLSLCETLASGMGGGLTAHNREGGGAEFTLTLPLAPEAA